MSETLPDKAAQLFETWRELGWTMMSSYSHHRPKADAAHVQALRDGTDLSEGDHHDMNAAFAVVGGFVIWASGAVGSAIAGAWGGHSRPNAEASHFVQIDVPGDQDEQ